MELNFDWAKINNIEKDSKGYLRLIGTIAKSGDLIYANKDGSKRIERVPFETLTHLDHLNSVVNCDFVLGHPDLINSSNYKKFTIGSVGSNVVVNEDNESLEMEYIVKDAEAVRKIETRQLKGLSMAYFAKKQSNEDGSFTQISGTRINNHHGLVQIPRCTGAGFNLDGEFNSDTWFNIDGYELPELPKINSYKKLFFIDNMIR